MISEHIEVFKYNEIDSTNNEAQRLIEKKNNFPFWVVADIQTSGRGRKNRQSSAATTTIKFQQQQFHRFVLDINC